MILEILLYMLAGLIAAIAGGIAVLIFDEIERLEEKNKKYEDDNDD